MIKDALEYIVNMRVPTIVNPNDIKNESLSDVPMHYLPSPPLRKPIVVNTLTGLMDYIGSDFDGHDGTVCVHIVDPGTVRIISQPLGRHWNHAIALLGEIRSEMDRHGKLKGYFDPGAYQRQSKTSFEPFWNQFVAKYKGSTHEKVRAIGQHHLSYFNQYQMRDIDQAQLPPG